MKQSLLIVDVQNGFLNDHAKKCLPHILELASSGDFRPGYRNQVRQTMKVPHGGLRWGGTRIRSVWEIAVPEEIEQAADIFIEKPRYSLVGTVIRNLFGEGDHKVVIVGIDTDACVLAVATSLFDAGIPVTVDLDGCASTGGVEAERAAQVILPPRIVGRSNVVGEGA